MKLSIVIAAYNIEKYIEKCLVSVLSQIDNNAELIIVNDGSSDNTKEIIEYICKIYSDKNILLHNKINSGISDTRNLGMSLSKGEYIAFLDGDDIWSKDYYSTIMSVIECESYDLIEYNAFKFSKCENKVDSYIDIVSGIKGSLENDRFNKLNPVFKKSNWFVWARVFRKELISKFKFPTGRRFEDLCIMPLIYLKAKTIYSIEKPLIGYRQNNGSITRNLKRSDIDDVNYALKEWFSKEENNNLTKDEKTLLSIASLRLAVYIKYLNQVINEYDFSETKELRKNY
ncbi:glycosyltransferase family 2 protein [Photobacterium kishitanii]|uniref:glycosyltransferase family 2 protein n=1 Tax=Photobacterium kishitanii TaxID=318456 RepID=UPI002738624D|nr:glycosyltransferase [Photobacterium kishitanii]